MGLVKFGVGVSEISGAVGGVVFSKNHAGCILRTNKQPIKSKKINTISSQNKFGYLTNYYKTQLSSAEKTAWIDYANATPLTNRLSETYYMTGLQAFMRCNIPLYGSSWAIIDAAPTSGGLLVVPPLDTSKFVVDNSLGTIAISSGAFPDLSYVYHNIWYFIFQCLPKPYGSTWIFDRPRLVGSFVHESGASPSYPLSYNKIWSIPTGYIQGLLIKRVDEYGKASNASLLGKVIIS